MKKYTLDDVAQWAAAYREGASLSQVARRYDVGIATVHRRLTEHHPEILREPCGGDPRASTTDPAQVRRAIAERPEGVTYAQIAARFGISPSRVSQIMRVR